MARNLEDLLATLSDHDLGQMQARARGDVAQAREGLKRIEVELDLIERAIARKARRTGGATGQGNATRDAVMTAFADGQELSPAEVITAVYAQGATVKEGAIRAMIRRLAEEGYVHKRANSRYQRSGGGTLSPDNPFGNQSLQVSPNGADQPEED